jgi:hypothetical protein
MESLSLKYQGISVDIMLVGCGGKLLQLERNMKVESRNLFWIVSLASDFELGPKWTTSLDLSNPTKTVLGESCFC